MYRGILLVGGGGGATSKSAARTLKSTCSLSRASMSGSGRVDREDVSGCKCVRGCV